MTFVQALWFLGELGDSCDDLCEFKGYAGCDEVETAKLTTRPRISRLMMGLNSSCSSQSSSGTSISPAYNPSTGQCHRISGQARLTEALAFSSLHLSGSGSCLQRRAVPTPWRQRCSQSASATARP